MRNGRNIAVYTTVYPSVLRFFEPWHRSLLSQTDRDFVLWVGLDGVCQSEMEQKLGPELDVVFHEAGTGDTPVTLRNNALARLVERHGQVVFVDSDDILEPDRVRQAREALQKCDLAGCGMQIVDESGRDTGERFGPPDGANLIDLLLDYNIFGMTNTAFRTAVLARHLPVPPECVAMDWYLASMAAFAGCSLGFERWPMMQYRQYGANTAKVLPPFTAADLQRSWAIVNGHYACLLDRSDGLEDPFRHKLEKARNRVLSLSGRLSREQSLLDEYLCKLNSLPCSGIWWTQACHPDIDLEPFSG